MTWIRSLVLGYVYSLKIKLFIWKFFLYNCLIRTITMLNIYHYNIDKLSVHAYCFPKIHIIYFTDPDSRENKNYSILKLKVISKQTRDI